MRCKRRQLSPLSIPFTVRRIFDFSERRIDEIARMQLLWMILSFFAKIALFAVVLFSLSLKITKTTSILALLGQFIVSYCISFAVFYVDEVYLYPKYRNPLRHLPSVNSGYNARLITETPRGASTLRWVIAQPEADLIHSRGKLGQSILYPVGPDALRDIMATNADDFEKPTGLRSYLIRVLGNGLITQEGAQHKRDRKSLTWAFNIKHIRALYPTMWQKAGLLVQRMEAESQSAGFIEITTWASRYALDIIGRGALSRDFDALSMKTYHPIAKAFSKLLEPEHYMVQFLALTIACPPFLVKYLPNRANRCINENAGIVRKACAEILDSKRAALAKNCEKAASEVNILSKLIGSGDMKRDEILHSMVTFIGAGHETSASSITWACHLLSLPENHHYQDILRYEVRSAFPTITSSDGQRHADFGASEATLQSALENMPYLNGICEEVLRLFPAVPATLRESIRRTTIQGTVVPKDTLIVIMPWAINRNPRFWGPDADRMRPERWIDYLPDGTHRANKHGGAVSNYCEITFLHGQHACLGRDFAKAELKCALAAIFGHLELRRLDGDDGKVRVQGAVTTKPRGGLKLKLNPISGW